jgi:hypothetical protein
MHYYKPSLSLPICVGVVLYIELCFHISWKSSLNRRVHTSLQPITLVNTYIVSTVILSLLPVHWSEGFLFSTVILSSYISLLVIRSYVPIAQSAVDFEDCVAEPPMHR